jgi:hypothetical protein
MDVHGGLRQFCSVAAHRTRTEHFAQSVRLRTTHWYRTLPCPRRSARRHGTGPSSGPQPSGACAHVGWRPAATRSLERERDAQRNAITPRACDGCSPTARADPAAARAPTNVSHPVFPSRRSAQRPIYQEAFAPTCRPTSPGSWPSASLGTLPRGAGGATGIAAYRRQNPHAPPVAVGDMGLRHGGEIDGHSTRTGARSISTTRAGTERSASRTRTRRSTCGRPANSSAPC